MVDHDILLLHAQQERISLLKDASSLDDEEDYIYSYHAMLADSNIKHYFTHKHYIGKHHPFSSADRLNEVKQSLSETPVIPVFCDIFSRDQISLLRGLLTRHNAKIVFANISNAMDYYNPFYELTPFKFEEGMFTPSVFFSSLPFSRDAMLAFYVFEGKNQLIGANCIQVESAWDVITDNTRVNILSPVGWRGIDRISNCPFIRGLYYLIDSIGGKASKIANPKTELHALLAHTNSDDRRALSCQLGHIFNSVNELQVKTAEKDEIKSLLLATI